jgi:hypothetical protein
LQERVCSEHHPWNCETLPAKAEKSEVAPSCKRPVTGPLLFEQEYFYENLMFT